LIEGVEEKKRRYLKSDARKQPHPSSRSISCKVDD
jgi:hypothetical protein